MYYEKNFFPLKYLWVLIFFYVSTLFSKAWIRVNQIGYLPKDIKLAVKLEKKHAKLILGSHSDAHLLYADWKERDSTLLTQKQLFFWFILELLLKEACFWCKKKRKVLKCFNCKFENYIFVTDIEQNNY